MPLLLDDAQPLPSLVGEDCVWSVTKKEYALFVASQLIICNFQNQPKILTKKVKKLDKRNFHSREGFSAWHAVKC